MPRKAHSSRSSGERGLKATVIRMFYIFISLLDCINDGTKNISQLQNYDLISAYSILPEKSFIHLLIDFTIGVKAVFFTGVHLFHQL